MSSLSPINLQFIATSQAMKLKSSLYCLTSQRASDTVTRTSSTNGSSNLVGVGVSPTTADGNFYQTDLSLGLTESADDILITDAICSISQSRNIVQTSLAGRDGTIKEYISNGDYDINIVVGLVTTEDGAVIDEYPEAEVKQLRILLEQAQALYVDSEFLRIFDITKLVITSYSLNQDTHSNYQVINIRALSDEDYVISSNDY